MRIKKRARCSGRRVRAEYRWLSVTFRENRNEIVRLPTTTFQCFPLVDSSDFFFVVVVLVRRISKCSRKPSEAPGDNSTYYRGHRTIIGEPGLDGNNESAPYTSVCTRVYTPRLVHNIYIKIIMYIIWARTVVIG